MPSLLFCFLLLPLLLPIALAVDTPHELVATEPSSFSLIGGFTPSRSSREGRTSRGSRPSGQYSRTQFTSSREREVTCHQGVWDLQEHTKATQPFESDCRAIYDDLTTRSPLQRRTSRGDYWWYRRKAYCQITVVLLPGQALQSALASQLRMQDSIWRLVLEAIHGILTECVEAQGLGGYYYFDEEKAKFKVTIGESPPLMVYEEEEEEQENEPLLGTQVTYRPSSATSCPSMIELVPPRQPGGMMRSSPPIFRQQSGSPPVFRQSGSSTRLDSSVGRRPSSLGPRPPFNQTLSSPRLSQLESQATRQATGEIVGVWESMVKSFRDCCNRLDCCGCCTGDCWRDPATWAQAAVAVNLLAATANMVGNALNVAAATANLRYIEKNHANCPPCPAPPPFPDPSTGLG